MTFDGMYVTYTDEHGVVQKAFAGADYVFWNDMLAIHDRQLENDRKMANVKGKYLNDLADYAAVPTAHQVPVKPKLHVINDQGVESDIDFPGLPDPVPVVTNPSQGSGKTTTLVLNDYEKLQMAALDALYKQNAKILENLAKIIQALRIPV